MLTLSELTAAAHQKREQHGISADKAQVFMAGFFEGATFIDENKQQGVNPDVVVKLDLLIAAVEKGESQFRAAKSQAQTPDQRTASSALVEMCEIINSELKEIRTLL